MVPTSPVHIVVGPGTGTRDRTKSKNHGRVQKKQSQQVLRREINFLKKNKDQNYRIGKIYRFGGWTDSKTKNRSKSKDRPTNQVLTHKSVKLLKVK